MVEEGYDLLTKHGFLGDIGITIWRVLGGFTLAARAAVPLGITMGAYKPIEAFLRVPFVSFARYLPASAFIPPPYPVGAGPRPTAEPLVIFIGSVFQLVLMVAVAVAAACAAILVEGAATTAGRAQRPRSIIARVLIPASAPREEATDEGLGFWDEQLAQVGSRVMAPGCGWWVSWVSGFRPSMTRSRRRTRAMPAWSSPISTR